MASLKKGVQTEVQSAPFTISVGLDCCNTSDLAWPTLRDETDFAATFPDQVPADGVRVLHRAGIVSGESAAATGVGFLRALQSDQTRCRALCLDKSSKVLVFNTEGTTAPTITAKILADTSPIQPAPAAAIETLRCTHEKSRAPHSAL
jgi:diaminopropionate ammonia-lyase